MGKGSSGGGTSPQAVPEWLWGGKDAGGFFYDIVKDAGANLQVKVTMGIARNPYFDQGDPYYWQQQLVSDSDHRVTQTITDIEDIIDIQSDTLDDSLDGSRVVKSIADWRDILSEVVQQFNTTSDLDDDISGLTTNTLKAAVTEAISSAVSNAIVRNDSGGTAPVGAAWSRITDLPTEWIRTMVGNMVEDARGRMDNVASKVWDEITRAQSEAYTDGKEVDSFMTDVDDSVKTALELLDTPAQEVVTTAITALTSALTTAINSALTSAQAKAATLIDSDDIESLVSTFETAKLREHYRAVNRLAGGLVDINAQMSSAYIWGHAGLESDFQNSISAYRAQLNLDSYNTVMQSYLQTFSQGLGNGLANISQILTNVMGVVSQATDASARIYASSFASMMQNVVSTMQTAFGGEIQLESDGLQFAQGMTSENMKGFLASLQSYSQHMIGEISERRRMKLAFLDRNVAMMETDKNSWLKFKENIMLVGIQKESLTIDAFRQEAIDDLKLQENAAMWSFDVIQRAVNVLAASGGGIGHETEPLTPSTFQNVLAGATAGASVTGGNPLGAIVGGLVGGLSE